MRGVVLVSFRTTSSAAARGHQDEWGLRCEQVNSSPLDPPQAKPPAPSTVQLTRLLPGQGVGRGSELGSGHGDASALSSLTASDSAAALAPCDGSPLVCGTSLSHALTTPSVSQPPLPCQDPPGICCSASPGNLTRVPGVGCVTTPISILGSGLLWLRDETSACSAAPCSIIQPQTCVKQTCPCSLFLQDSPPADCQVKELGMFSSLSFPLILMAHPSGNTSEHPSIHVPLPIPSPGRLFVTLDRTMCSLLPGSPTRGVDRSG